MKYLVAFFLTAFGAAEVNAQHEGSTKNKQAQILYLNSSALFLKVIEVKGMSADLLYNKMEDWTRSTFNSSSDVVNRKIEGDIIQGVGIEPGITLYGFPRLSANLKYLFTVEVEDNKICFTMSNMSVLSEAGKYTLEEYLYDKNGREIFDKQTKNIKSHATKIANVLMNSLQLFLVENSVDMNDWE